MFLQIILCTACHERIVERPEAGGSKIINVDTLYSFDVNKKSVAQPFDPGAAKVQYKFVQVEVTKVVNPNLHPVTFEVHYRVGNTERIFLGSFSLYPSDNPGKFIVPTQGKLNKPGSVILSLILPEEIGKDDPLKVTTKKIQFIKK